MFNGIGLPFFNKTTFMMKINSIFLTLLTAVLVIACGPSKDEAERLSAQERARLKTLDSLAFKVGVQPTLDCLPVYVAHEEHLFDSLGVDVRLRPYGAAIDCDAAFRAGRLQAAVTDLVSCRRMAGQGVPLRYAAATNAYWQLVSNRQARIRHIKQLKDKMMAMTRFSATDMLGDYAVDSAGLVSDHVFRIQINDPGVRLGMLLNNEMDAMFLSEPHATAARMHRHVVLMDSRDKDLWLGVVALYGSLPRDVHRRRQEEAFVKAYDRACDMINKNGVRHYAETIRKYCKVDGKVVAALPEMKYRHAAQPRTKDLEAAGQWLKNK